ncbi:unnamed protein product [Effrenium voratum]|nr:unnamed protein product [Effrenium voratum]
MSAPDALFCHRCGQDCQDSGVDFNEVLEVLRAARYPARLEVTWTLTEVNSGRSPLSFSSEEAIVSGQASLPCKNAGEAEALVAKLSSSLASSPSAEPRTAACQSPAADCPQRTAEVLRAALEPQAQGLAREPTQRPRQSGGSCADSHMNSAAICSLS